ncbi:TPA: HXXEE domain-containing protein [Escherichia coli]|nr:HXXEE domain-containing protein [Escherichia coli]
MKYNLVLFSIIATGVLIFTLVNWSELPVTQRMLGLFVFGITLHLWEEGRFPRGFTELIAEKLGFKADNLHFGQIVTSCYVIYLVFVPLFFPNVTFLVLAPMLLGVLEVIAHIAAIKMFGKSYYSPGLFTAVVVLMPLSVFTLHYIVTHHIARTADWVMALVYMIVGLLLAQRLVITAS